ncbi:MAG TPA: metallophosphoesterase [Devosia sp.]|jgi:Icc-related predicted phosphoesterase|uniref:metallophosphoesterase n=1 Tax=Devosia sp. TaxID=1871048 RepID=UPI002F957991
MRIWTISDLHTEFGPWEPPNIPDADVCLLAGDIAKGAVRSIDWIKTNILPHMPAVMVLGNHEFYGSSIQRELRLAREYAPVAGVHLLENSGVEIDGVRFLGATLWTDYDLYAKGDERLLDRYMDIANKGMNDHQTIKARDFSTIPFEPEHARAIHLQSVAWLDEALSEEHDGPTVVVTHHLPSNLSVADRFRDETLSAAYASNLDWLMEKHGPALWAHGHTHDSCDYEIGSTRVLCNPKGYPPEKRARVQRDENPDFDPGLVVEIGEPRPKLGM